MAKSELITAEKTLDATPGQKVEQFEKLMHPRVLEISNTWLAAMRERRIGDIQLYWQMATDLQTIVSDPEVYGHETAKTLLARHGVEVTSLRAYLSVKQNLSQEFIDEVIAYNSSDVSRYGLATASHLVLLSAEPDPKVRKKLWIAVKKEKLSVADLADRIKAAKNIGEEGVDDLAKRRVVTVLGKTIKTATLLLENVQTICTETFSNNLPNVKEADLDEAIKRCDEAMGKVRDICHEGENALLTLENTRERLVHQRTQAAIVADAKGRELKQRQTTSKKKLEVAAAAAAAAAADNDFADDDDDTVEGIVTSSKSEPVAKKPVRLSKPAKAEKPTAVAKPAVYKNSKLRAEAEAETAEVEETAADGAPAAAPAKSGNKLRKVLRRPRPVAK